MSKQCPNCVVELIPNKKKLGLCTNWLICPNCGHRERDTPNRKETYFCNYRDKINASGGRLKMAE
jgi:primosomal protein N'